MSFAPIVEFESLPAAMAPKIMQAGWPALSGKIDVAFGAGKIDKHTKAVWTIDGKRITVFYKDAFIVSQSQEPDPLYFERKAEGGAQ